MRMLSGVPSWPLCAMGSLQSCGILLEVDRSQSLHATASTRSPQLTADQNLKPCRMRFNIASISFEQAVAASGAVLVWTSELNVDKLSRNVHGALQLRQAG